MKVKATRTGYYNNKRQKPGSVFELVPYQKLDEKGKPVEKDGEPVIVSAAEQFSKNWMVEVKSKKYIEVDEEVEALEESEGDEPVKGKAKGGRPKKSTGDQEVI